MHVVVDILFVAFAALTVFICAKRGFFLSLLKFFKALLALAAAFLWGGVFGKFLAGKFIYPSVYNSVFNKLNEIVNGMTGGLTAENAMKAVPAFLRTEELQQQLAAMEGSVNNGTDSLINSMTEVIANTVSNVIGVIIGFIAVFIIAFVVLTVVYFLLKGLKKKIGIINKVDALLGALLGLVMSFMLLLLAGSVLKLFFAGNDMYANSVIAKFFGESSLLDILKFLNVNELVNKFKGA